MQLFVFGRQARRLKESVEKMDEVAAAQAADMASSIAESARAATAMERVGTGITDSTNITADMARLQREFGQKQMRAYISVVYGATVPQDNSTGWRNEIRLLAINNGHTPAHDVRYRASADVLPFPLPEDFTFPLQGSAYTSTSVVGPGQNIVIHGPLPRMLSEQETIECKSGQQRMYMWGIVTYKDAFDVERSTKFSQYIVWMRNGTTMSSNTLSHNESD